MNCRNCGKEITNNVKVCSECGEKVLYEIEVIEDKNIQGNMVDVSMIDTENKDNSSNIIHDGTNNKHGNRKTIMILSCLILVIIFSSCYFSDRGVIEKADKNYEMAIVNLKNKDFNGALENLQNLKSLGLKIDDKNYKFFSKLKILNKDYKDALVMEYYAKAGKDFEEGLDLPNIVYEISDNYSGLFSQEINALKQSAKERNEKIAAEKEAAEREKKRKEEEAKEKAKREALKKVEAERRESNNSGVSPSDYQTPFGHILSTIPKIGRPLLKVPDYTTDVINMTMVHPGNGKEMGKRRILCHYKGVSGELIVEVPGEIVTTFVFTDTNAGGNNQEVINILSRQYGAPTNNVNTVWFWDNYPSTVRYVGNIVSAHY